MTSQSEGESMTSQNKKDEGVPSQSQGDGMTSQS